MLAHAITQETRIKALTAQTLACEQQREQWMPDVRDYNEVVKQKEKEHKIWKYTQQLGDKAADWDMDAGTSGCQSRDGEAVEEKSECVKREKQAAGRK